MPPCSTRTHCLSVHSLAQSSAFWNPWKSLLPYRHLGTSTLGPAHLPAMLPSCSQQRNPTQHAAPWCRRFRYASGPALHGETKQATEHNHQVGAGGGAWSWALLYTPTRGLEAHLVDLHGLLVHTLASAPGITQGAPRMKA